MINLSSEIWGTIKYNIVNKTFAMINKNLKATNLLAVEALSFPNKVNKKGFGFLSLIKSSFYDF